MTQADVRKCPEDEIVPLFKKMVDGNTPTDVGWRDSNRCQVIFKKGKAEIRFQVDGTRGPSFNFYPGVDNIRFDGILEDSACRGRLSKMIEYGRGTKVSDFFDLS